MRKYLQAGIVVVSALIVASPAATADAATGHVLTAGGAAVKVGAVLKAGVAKGSAAVFSLGSEKLTCKAASFSAKVTSNPARPGHASESLTAQKFSKCTINVQGVTLRGIKVSNLPYKVTVSDAKGLPVRVSGRSKSKPLLTTVTAALGTLVVTCSYEAKSITGHASNKGNVITFTKQKFVLAPGSSGFCAASANFSGSFGPVVNSSVKGSPKVFVK
jgi:hypothetical protein